MTGDELEAVKFRAYQIWDREGRPHGRHEDHWQQALQELGLNQQRYDATVAIAAQSQEWDASEEEQ